MRIRCCSMLSGRKSGQEKNLNLLRKKRVNLKSLQTLQIQDLDYEKQAVLQRPDGENVQGLATNASRT